MGKNNFPEDANEGKSKPLNVRLSTSDFGPISNGEVDLRPLTVFVGPSNSGKTYFATLVYALHRILGGFSRLPVRPFEYSSQFRIMKVAFEDSQVYEREVSEFLNAVEAESDPLRFSDIPRWWRELILSPLNESWGMGEDLQEELRRCFDLDSVSSLIRWSDTTSGSDISLSVGEGDQSLWQLRMRITDAGVTTEGNVDNNVFSQDSLNASEFEMLTHRFHVHQSAHLRSNNSDLFVPSFLVDELLELLFTGSRGKAHYLPAARSGIMQSHRVIASSLVGRSTRAGFQSFPELPTFTGVMADFMQGLILFDERQKTTELMEGLAKALELNTLAGEIGTYRSSPAAYPEFVYRPRRSNEDIRLTRASSMVSELAPVVLFLRGVIKTKDLIIIEEPEAHLHPGAQTQMAVILGQMVRAGLQVLVTTHSDWLLKELSNLMREGKLGEMSEGKDANGLLPPSLQTNEVGIWKFSKDSSSGTSSVEEIPFDPIEGVEPQDYEDIAVDLYNRSANLQNRLEESASG